MLGERLISDTLPGPRAPAISLWIRRVLVRSQEGQLPTPYQLNRYGVSPIYRECVSEAHTALRARCVRLRLVVLVARTTTCVSPFGTAQSYLSLDRQLISTGFGVALMSYGRFSRFNELVVGPPYSGPRLHRSLDSERS